MNDIIPRTEEFFGYIRDTVKPSSLLAKFGPSDAAMEYRRRHTITYTDPTPEQWEAYEEAVKHLEALNEYDGFYAGYDGPELVEPHPTPHIEYTETVGEWKARVAALINEAGGTLPEDLGAALSRADHETLGIKYRGWSRTTRYNHVHVGFEVSPEA